jgi:hypothetical protein
MLARRRGSVPWSTLVLLGVFFAIGLQSGRGMFWWALLLPATIAPYLPDDGGGSQAPIPAPVALGVVAMTLFVGLAFFPWLRAAGTNGETLLSGAPIRLTAALRDVTRSGSRVFEAQPLGSWLEWSLPDRRFVIDSRIELFTPAEWHAYEDVSAGLEGWQEGLDRLRVDVVVATADQQRSLLPRIAADPGWRLAYRDRDGSVFVRA